jgi:hypothetical protein
MLRTIVHMGLHVGAPGVVARLGFGPSWRRAWLIMVATMIVDLDHLLSTPLFDPNRCSIGLHPLHTAPAIAAYLLLALFSQSRPVAAGLILHMLLDGIDCLWMGWVGAGG